MAMNSTRRKLVIASWSRPTEGNIYGKLEIDATEAKRYLAHIRETTGERVTITHLVGKALALALQQAPGLNGTIRFGSFVPHPWINISFLVALDGGANLAKARIDSLDVKPLSRVAVELREMAERLRAGKDDEFQKAMGPVRLLPSWILRPLLRITGWLTAALGVNMPALGLTAYPFGSAVVTSVGMMGLDEGYAPPTPFARVPLWVLVGKLAPRPMVHDGEVVAREGLTITATIDHRFLDGAQGAKLANHVRDVLENPWQLDEEDNPSA